MKRVLVLDALQRSALAVTRSLGAHGITVITADETATALAGRSRFSHGYFSYPSPRRQPGQFISCLVELVRTQQIGVILPMTELTTLLLLQNRARFDNVTIPFPAPDTVNRLADKCTLMELAVQLDIPVPASRCSGGLPAQAAGSIPAPDAFPVVVKPGMSWLMLDNEWRRNGVRFAGDQAELERIVTAEPAFQAHGYLVQECIAGAGQGIFALYDQGHAVAFFSHRRLREKPPSGGVSVLSESIPLDPVMLGHARRLLDHAGWHGVAMVEFKVAADGTPYLMEINTRFWGSLQLAIDAGVDFPWLLYQLACGEHPAAPDGFRSGVRLRWLLGDLDALYLALKDRRSTLAGKLNSVLRFLLPARHTRHEINRPGDLGPFWWELGNYLRALFH